MQITMCYTRRVSEDGFTIRVLSEGETYEVADSAARLLIRQRQAFQVGCTPPAPLPPSPFNFKFPEVA